MARRTLLTKDTLRKIDTLTHEGLTCEQIAHELKMHKTTIYKGLAAVNKEAWMNACPLPKDEATREQIREHFRTGAISTLRETYHPIPGAALKHWYDELFPHLPKQLKKQKVAAEAFTSGQTIEQIADSMLVTPQTVRNWLKQEDLVIPRRTAGRPHKRPYHTLIRENFGGIRDTINLYRNQGVSRPYQLAKLISQHYNFPINQTTVALILYWQNVQYDDVSSKRLATSFKIAESHYMDRMPISAITEVAEKSEPTVYSLLHLHCAFLAHYHKENPLDLWRSRKGSKRIADLHAMTPATAVPDWDGSGCT